MVISHVKSILTLTVGFALFWVGCTVARPNDDADYIYYGSAGASVAVSGGYAANGSGSGSGGIVVSSASAGTGRSAGTTETIDAGVDATCAASSVVPEQAQVEVPVEVIEKQPVALYLMLDQSGTMQEMPDGVTTKFTIALNSVSTLVKDPASADLDVALQYFPLTAGDCSTGAGYNSPEVAMGRLPGNATAIEHSLSAHALMVNTFTPMEGALRGATAFCEKFKTDKTANPDGEDCVVVLVTDGEPNSCPVSDGAGMAAIAQAAYDRSKVMTYTMGMAGLRPEGIDVLNKIALAGHTDCTPSDSLTNYCDVSAGQAAFIAALELIRKSVTKTITKTETQTQPLPCNWNVPPPPPNETIDFKKVNVQFSPTGSDKDKQIIGMVDSKDKCGLSGGWYYNTPANPTQVIACETTCATIKAAKGGKIGILLGCETVEVR
jgi:hypothetical protein